MASGYDAAYARETLTFAGAGLRPYSPVHVRGTRGATGDVALTSVRRTRSGGDTWEGTEVPLGGAVEA